MGSDELRREHRRWLANTLDSTAGLLMIADDQHGRPVGQVRLDPASAPGSFMVSLILAPDARGRRLASAVLVAVEEPARAHGAARLLARIRRSNEASTRAFKAAGYYQFTDRGEGAVDELWCERRIRPFT